MAKGTAMLDSSATRECDHVPPHIFQEALEGIISIPFANEYMKHIESCAACCNAYTFVEKKKFSLNSLVDEENWELYTQDEQKTTKLLLAALETCNYFRAVSGELSLKTWTPECQESLKALLERGGVAQIVAGPDIPDTHFIRSLAKKYSNLSFYCSDERQDFHFAIADLSDVVYFDDVHATGDEERRMANEKARQDSGLAAHLSIRFQTTINRKGVHLQSA